MSTDSPRVVDTRPKRRRQTVGLVIAAVLLVTTLFIAWFTVKGRPNDPRAYPGSQSQSLDELLQRYKLAMPQCADQTVRYLLYVQGITTDSFYLYFRAKRPCIDEFLGVNKLADGETYETAGLPFEHVGDWPQDASKKYTASRNTLETPGSPSLVSVEIALDLSAADIGLYLQAGIL